MGGVQARDATGIIAKLHPLIVAGFLRGVPPSQARPPASPPRPAKSGSDCRIRAAPPPSPPAPAPAPATTTPTLPRTYQLGNATTVSTPP